MDNQELINQMEGFIRYYFFASGVLGGFVGVIICKFFEALYDILSNTPSK